MGLKSETISSVCLGVQCTHRVLGFRHLLYGKCNLLWACKHDLDVQKESGNEAWLSTLTVNRSPRMGL